jgi:hypothetical protein
MKEADKTIVFECLCDYFRHAPVKEMMEDVEWHEAGIDWDNPEEVRALEKEIRKVCNMVTVGIEDRISDALDQL